VDQEAIGLVEHVFVSGETVVREAFPVQFTTPEGTVDKRLFNLACLPTRAVDGSIDGVMIHAVDVTKEVAAVRARDEFLSIAGHELRTPLTSLQLTVQGLLRQANRDLQQPASRLVTKLALAEQLVRRQGRLIEDLLDVSRIAEGRLALEVEDFDLGELITEIVARCSDEATHAGCQIAFERGQPVRGRWDRARVEQVLVNLVSNAMKYGRGAPIEIHLQATDTHARVTVVDHGIGITASDQARIFERFFRANSGAHFGGFGLGLWISREIVIALKGTLSVTSKPGDGATFTVELPLAVAK
jgi:signal transduction histidine kinase